MKKNIVKIYVAMVLVFIMLSNFSYATENEKVVLITMNEVNFQELYSMNSVKKMIDNGAIALMNSRTSNRANVYKAYATIGASVRAEASSNTTQCFNMNDEIHSIYTRRTGKNISDQGIVNIDIAKLSRLNESGQYGAIAGSLGESLHEKGMKTAAIGNGDIEDQYIRLAPIIAMDKNGYVDYGDVGENILKKDETYSFGVKSNYDKMLEIFKDVYKKSELTVIDIGDIGRLERNKSNLADLIYVEHKEKILKDADLFIGQLLEHVNLNTTRIALVTPYPSSIDYKDGNKLTPVVFYGNQIDEGILTSKTTKREGIIGNVDIAPSIAEYLKSDANHMGGKAVRFIAKENNFDYLIELNDRVVSTSKNRYPILSTFAIFEILVSILGLTMVFIANQLNSKKKDWLKTILLSTMAVPFVLLIIPIFKVNDLLMTYILMIGVTFIITYSTKKISKSILDSILILSFVTTLGLIIDICTGGNLIKNSLLGYDPIIGARYYGIGNEYMGVLIASTLVFATVIIDRFKINKWWSVLIFLITMATIGYPKLGANVGGTITAIAAFTFASLRIFNIKMRMKQFMMIGILIVSGVVLMAFIDIKLLGGQSHLAGAIGKILEGGIVEIVRIINRKISMNLKLIGITIWSKVLMSAIIILATLFYKPVGTMNKLNRLYPNLSIGWSGIVAACIVAFFVNDSGVVAAATGIIFLAMSMLYLTFYVLEKE